MTTQGFDRVTGDVFIRNFDRGVVETMGGYIIAEPPTDDLILRLGGRKKNYYIEMPGFDPIYVPVVFNDPESVKEKKNYPSFVIIRNDPVAAMHRWHSVYQREYRAVGPNGTIETVNGVSGYSEVEEKAQDMPFDLMYDIQIHARYEYQAIPMLQKVLSVYKPYSKIDLLDSLGEERSYTVFSESVNDIGELIDVADRMKGYSVSIRIEGELSLSQPAVTPTALEFEVFGARRSLN